MKRHESVTYIDNIRSVLAAAESDLRGRGWPFLLVVAHASVVLAAIAVRTIRRHRVICYSSQSWRWGFSVSPKKEIGNLFFETRMSRTLPLSNLNEMVRRMIEEGVAIKAYAVVRPGEALEIMARRRGVSSRHYGDKVRLDF